ncbi:hypothetical protein JXA27_07015 [Aerococcaceae bacterium zg-B36]|uniref:hypothetical protein n=1 Tax=Aerococcaceae bacterium zg-252 TaxID=2796928 RepID=UPI001BD8E53B|nr:hypothetical protein [Aerococcaceae bacterium zg-B36]
MLTVDKIRLPITHFELSDYADDRFKKVKIWIAHTGENLNHTVFSKDALTKMAETLPYVPIVGYIEKNEDNEEDFSDHRSTIVIRKGGMDIEYLGKPCGFIPANPTVGFEFRQGKEWLVCEGYLWTKFTNVIKIFENSNGSKHQSMEIDNVDGFVDEYGRTNFETARFSALCVLGDSVMPGMKGSTIEFFSLDEFKNDVREMIIEFSKKGEEMLKDNEEVVETVDDTENEDVVDTVEDVEVEDVEIQEDTDTEEFSSDESELDSEITEDEEAEDEIKEETEVIESNETEETAEFSLSFDQITNKLRTHLYEQYDKYLYINHVFADEVVYSVADTDNEYVSYKADYVISGGVVSIKNQVRVEFMYVTIPEKEEIEKNRQLVKELQEELKALQAFKAEVEDSEKDSVINTYASKLSKEDVQFLKENKVNFSKIELEKEIAYKIFTNTSSFIDKEGESSAVFSYEADKKVDLGFGELNRLFNK